MTTLIAVHNSEGCVGRCDAKCHDATSGVGECDCVCGGRNHGVGRKKALENTRAYAEEMIEEYARMHGMADYVKEINWGELMQMRMPGF